MVDTLPRRKPSRVGNTVMRFVNVISHRSGAVFAVMDEYSITLPQVLLLSRIMQLGAASSSNLLKGSHVTAAALSQMIERLVRQGLLNRTEDFEDGRRKVIIATPRARAILRKLDLVRSAEYEVGLKGVNPRLRRQMAKLLERAILEIDRARPSDGPRRRSPTKRRRES